MKRMQAFNLIFQIVPKMPEYPIVVLVVKFPELLQCIASRRGNRLRMPAGQEAFDTGMGKFVSLVVEERKNAEPFSPVQHLYFGFFKISYRKRPK
jgi:hypothetical protein